MALLRAESWSLLMCRRMSARLCLWRRSRLHSSIPFTDLVVTFFVPYVLDIRVHS